MKESKTGFESAGVGFDEFSYIISRRSNLSINIIISCMEVKFLDDEVEMNKRAAQHSIYQ